VIHNRRALITGLVALIASPAIVRASSLMKVKAWDDFSTDAMRVVSRYPLRDTVMVTLRGWDAHGSPMVETREISMLAWVDGSPITATKKYARLDECTISEPDYYASGILEHPRVVSAQSKYSADLRHMLNDSREFNLLNSPVRVEGDLSLHLSLPRAI
jgi:hypothetical protein